MVKECAREIWAVAWPLVFVPQQQVAKAASACVAALAAAVYAANGIAGDPEGTLGGRGRGRTGRFKRSTRLPALGALVLLDEALPLLAGSTMPNSGMPYYHSAYLRIVCSYLRIVCQVTVGNR